MPQCDVCRERVDLPHQCTRCGGTFCGRHRLPEAHDCPALDDWAQEGTGGSGDGPDGDGADGATPDGSRGVHSPGRGENEPSVLGWVAGYLRRNVTYVFLALMVLTFAAQTILFPLAGYTATSPVWNAAFVLTTAHPEYVWTWITSIFAHGGIFHLLVNGVVVFLFGRLVEEYVGSRRYALLFLGAGVLAGLAQVAVLAAQGVDSGVLGASGAALAVLGVLTGVNPRLRVYLFFAIPVPIWLFTGGYAALTVVRIQSGGTTAGGVAQFAHLVGLLVGLGYGLYEKGAGGQLPDRLRIGGGQS